MPSRPQRFQARPPRPKVEVEREHDQRRGSARLRGYTSRWDKASRAHGAHWPLCQYCEVGAWGDPPRVTPRALTDHLYPHKGDEALFWNATWWVSSCKTCHDGPKQAAERQGLTALNRLARLLGLPTLSES